MKHFGKQLLTVIIKKRKSWKGYATFADMPTLLLLFFVIANFFISAFLLFVLIKVVPQFVAVAHRTPLSQWGLSGWLLLAYLIFMMCMLYLSAGIMRRCNRLVWDRWLGPLERPAATLTAPPDRKKKKSGNTSS